MVNTESIAVYLVAILVVASFSPAVALGETVEGGTANVSQVGNAPAISVPDATLDGNGGDIEVAYNVTGEVDPSDAEIRLSGPFGDLKTGIESEEGKVTFSLPDRDAVGGYRVEASLIDTSTGTSPAFDSAAISSQSVSVTDFSVADSAAGNDEVYAGETFTMQATVDNDAQTERDVSLNGYIGWGASSDGKATVNVAGNDQETVEIPVEVPTYYDFSESSSVESTLAVNDRASQSLTVNEPPTVSASGNDVSVDSVGEIHPGDDVHVTATVTNDDSTYGQATVELEKDGSSTGKTKSVYLPADGSDTVVFTTSFDTAGEHTVSVAGNSATVTVAEPVAEVTDVTYLGGTEPNEKITAEDTYVTPPGGDGGLLQVDLWNDGATRPQDLGSLGIDETTRFRITIEIDDSYSPDALIATAQDASWTVTEGSDGYEATVEARPLEAQYISPSPDHGSWPTGEDDRADVSYDPMFSLAFHDFPSEEVARNVSGTILATDAQRFGSPLYYRPAPDEDPVLELSVSGPHYTVNGDVNRGQYEAFLPETLLDSWGVTGPDELEAAYQGENLDLNAEETDGGVYVNVPIHYSSGTVQISPSDTGSSGGESSGGSAPVGSDPSQTTTTTQEATTEEPTTTEPTTTTEAPTTTATTTPTTEEATATTETTRATATDSSDAPGFGVGAALVALAVAGLLAGRRRR